MLQLVERLTKGKGSNSKSLLPNSEKNSSGQYQRLPNHFRERDSPMELANVMKDELVKSIPRNPMIDISQNASLPESDVKTFYSPRSSASSDMGLRRNELPVPMNSELGTKSFPKDQLDQGYQSGRSTSSSIRGTNEQSIIEFLDPLGVSNSAHIPKATSGISRGNRPNAKRSRRSDAASSFKCPNTAVERLSKRSSQNQNGYLPHHGIWHESSSKSLLSTQASTSTLNNSRTATSIQLKSFQGVGTGQPMNNNCSNIPQSQMLGPVPRAEKLNQKHRDIKRYRLSDPGVVPTLSDSSQAFVHPIRRSGQHLAQDEPEGNYIAFLINSLEEEKRQLEDDLKLAKQLQEEEEIRQQQLNAPKKRTCMVCADDLEPLDFPVKPPTSYCEHGVNTCSGCLEQWIASDLESKGWERLTCPECGKEMQHEDIFRGASTKDFERYDRLVARALLAQDPNFIWCIAPGCGSGQLQEMSSNDPSLQKFICISCNSEHCIKHRVKWHAGESCEQYEYRVSGKQRRDAEEAASTALMNTTSKQCPGKKCGWRIEKSVGCDHMTCSKCGQEFCWQCLSSYDRIRKEGNTAHSKECLYHSDNVGRTGIHYPH